MSSTGAPVVELRSRAEVLAAAGGDVYVRCSAPDAEVVRAWGAGAGVAWFYRAPHRAGAGWLTVAAPTPVVPALVAAAVSAQGGAITGVTVPADALALLPTALRPVSHNLWDWFWTSTPPPVQPGEERVGWALDDDAAAITALLDGHSPRHSARPGGASVRRWCVLRDAGGELLACAAHVEYVAGVPHLASIVTRTDLRGRGLAGAITAWLTRQLLAGERQAAPAEQSRLDRPEAIVTLGMYGDNDVARRLYRRLGYTDSHHWASGPLDHGGETAVPGHH